MTRVIEVGIAWPYTLHGMVSRTVNRVRNGVLSHPHFNGKGTGNDIITQHSGFYISRLLNGEPKVSKKKNIYRIQFHNQGKLYELYAREVTQSNMYAFVEVADIIFGEKSKLVVDPSEERLKQEFSSVKRTYIPLHAVVRIDEVDKEGVNKIIESGSDSDSGNVAAFPMPPLQPKS